MSYRRRRKYVRYGKGGYKQVSAGGYEQDQQGFWQRKEKRAQHVQLGYCHYSLWRETYMYYVATFTLVKTKKGKRKICVEMNVRSRTPTL
ncbi:MAG: hypothetical protein DRJ47_07160 [Thermoprotei archaeon]|nr:MAG: hypothetical protein DRJ47_07160 [Thermoprotei archaeon]